jgi:hypothetical protein
MSLDDLIAELEGIIGKMVNVVDGDFVLAEHTNTFIDYTKKALELLQEIYEQFKQKTGKKLPNVETWISVAMQRTNMMEYRKFGDLVATADHNLVIDTLKCIEVSLIEIENNL